MSKMKQEYKIIPSRTKYLKRSASAFLFLCWIFLASFSCFSFSASLLTSRDWSSFTADIISPVDVRNEENFKGMVELMSLRIWVSLIHYCRKRKDRIFLDWSKLMEGYILCDDSTHQKGPVVSEDQN